MELVLLFTMSGSFIYDPIDTGCSTSKAEILESHIFTQKVAYVFVVREHGALLFWWLVKNPVERHYCRQSQLFCRLQCTDVHKSYTASGVLAKKISQPEWSIHYVAVIALLWKADPISFLQATFKTMGNLVPDWYRKLF